MSNIAILILAAGKSTRMGKPKQLLPVNNSTLLGITIKNALQSTANKVFCVLGAEFETVNASIENFNVEIIKNINYKNGLSSSIAEGITHINTQSYDAVLILLADQPNVNTSYINRLMEAYTKNKNKVVASNYKNNLGVPAIFPKYTFSKLLKLKGDKGAKEFLNSNSEIIMSIETNTQLMDIDTNEDYKNYLRNK